MRSNFFSLLERLVEAGVEFIIVGGLEGNGVVLRKISTGGFGLRTAQRGGLGCISEMAAVLGAGSRIPNRHGIRP